MSGGKTRAEWLEGFGVGEGKEDERNFLRALKIFYGIRTTVAVVGSLGDKFNPARVEEVGALEHFRRHGDERGMEMYRRWREYLKLEEIVNGDNEMFVEI